MKQKTKFAIAAGMAILGAISFFQVSSYSADMNNLNAMYIVGGIVLCGLPLIWFILQLTKQGPSNPR